MAEQPLVEALVEARGVDKTFGTGEAAVHALRTVSLRVDAGQLVVVKGRSGSGKTTLLNCLGGLETPDAGTVRIDGADLATMSSDDLVQLRRHRIGYVFQSFGLLPILSAAENVGVPMRLAGRDPRERDARVLELLSLVGLEGHAHQRPYELSGGQQQRVAIARALANDPAVLVADEPTGQLDTATGRAVMDLLRDLVHSRRLTAVVATHDPVMVAMADRVIDLADGAVVADTEAVPASAPDRRRRLAF